MKISVFLGFILIIVGNSKGNLEHGVDRSYSFSNRKLLTDWCSLTCSEDSLVTEQTTNLICEMGGKCDPRAPCKFPDIDKEKIIAIHNELRNTFAAGDEIRAKGIQVADMVALHWDEDLAFAARCNLAKCNDDFDYYPCINTPKFSEDIGTAVHSIWFSCKQSQSMDCAAKAIDEWIEQWYDEEVILTDKDQIRSYGKQYEYENGASKLVHFTQMMWSKTTHVGCAVMQNEKKGFDCWLVCNYGPKGNVEDERMFIEGTPCSKCPGDLQCGKTYKYLCGDGGVLDREEIVGKSQSSHVKSTDTTFGGFLYVALPSLAIFGQ